MNKLAIALLTITLLGNTLAQSTHHPVNMLRDVFASRLNALVIDCPAPQPEVACYEIGSSVEHHRWELDNQLAKFNDARWMIPWRQGDGYVMRFFVLDADPGEGTVAWVYGFTLYEQDTHQTWVLVTNLGSAAGE